MEVSSAGGVLHGIVGTKMSGASISRSVALYLSDSSYSASPPINWRWVESEAELACSQVTTAKRLLHQIVASVHRNILRSV
jgi:hypothetical protein